MQFEQRKGKEAQQGFTLVEVLLVVFILAMLSAIVIPRLSASSEIARRNADISTGHQVKSALDRYQVENGIYPKTMEIIRDTSGNITAAPLIPKYISKLTQDNTQQDAAAGKKGFGVASLSADGSIPDDAESNLIMLYLTTDGSAAEVRVYDSGLNKVLWSSAN
ncbi:prepilin-type N-terminal cleavage/methylation domain-containing protein [Desulfitobacterium dichloroeliminans LMG P-21439]|uniref:Prepilin-type N-terminal cleavage/methylation domain-containing protein n=1 Tax=Desulfitobacterium dichloroeliminans (strain LMG P-21439 / DCA1) TaxID=871963 RepID=L0FA98_DESDL|nr:prepilin-type N-terminal cleavage/methylation domain-containing protein [Desulfitobacterium dichloroeliminans]AGA69873.1 prepilin-type N-terminal cleavage/methylation domain-containing protein [Desulfitobacterium dichloroeliminans LMG P-21439]